MIRMLLTSMDLAGVDAEKGDRLKKQLSMTLLTPMNDCVHVLG
jgi:hypothetical protein